MSARIPRVLLPCSVRGWCSLRLLRSPKLEQCPKWMGHCMELGSVRRQGMCPTCGSVRKKALIFEDFLQIYIDTQHTSVKHDQPAHS